MFIKKISIKQAVDFCVTKWEFFYENPLEKDFYESTLVLRYPELKQLLSQCGLCSYDSYVARSLGYRVYYGDCTNCPLHERHCNCCQEYTKWESWKNKGNARWARYWANKLLNRLYELRLCIQNLPKSDEYE